MEYISLWKIQYIILIFLTKNAITARHWFPGTTGEVKRLWSEESEK